MKKILLILFLTIPVASFPQLRINEWMQSNIDCVKDDLQDFPDSWVELYNVSDQPVSLFGWAIANEENLNSPWIFTNDVVIPAQSFLLIYCDKAAIGLHASFRLDAGKEAIYLFNPFNKIVDSVKNIPKQPAPNISAGRIDDSGDLWAYFTEATPNAANISQTATTLLPDPVFSINGGIFKQPTRLSLSLPENIPDTETPITIHYTVDNSEPTIDSPVYTDSIEIATTTIVRAKLFHPDYLINRAKVHSYIIEDRDLTLPIISITTDSAYLWDEDFGIYCEGNGETQNWNYNWRRPMNVEYFPNADEQAVINQLGEMRVGGVYTRVYGQKSLIMYAHKRFGNKHFDYDFFHNETYYPLPSFMLRNSGNDCYSVHYNDALIQSLFGGKVDIDYQRYQPAIVYLNGVYWGIENIRDRSNEDFAAAVYWIEDVDRVENWQQSEVIDDLLNEIYKPTENIDYQWIYDHVDINEYINYMILQIYAFNLDWANNESMWRPQHESGKWRFILKDFDFGMGIYPADSVNIDYFIGDGLIPTRRFLQQMLNYEPFAKEFYTRWAIYMGDILHPNTTVPINNQMAQTIESEMQFQFSRWADEYEIYSINSWEWWKKYAVTAKTKWLENHNPFVYVHLRDYFNLGNIVKTSLSVGKDLPDNLGFTVNNIPLKQSFWEGYWFEQDTLHVRLSNSKTWSDAFVWQITTTKNNVAQTDYYTEPELDFVVPDDMAYQANIEKHAFDMPYMEDNIDIQLIYKTIDPQPGVTPTVRYFNLQGIEVLKPVKGNVYIVDKGGWRCKIFIVDR